MPTDWKTRSTQLRAGELVKVCEVTGCRLPTYRLGSICAGHRAALRAKGSTTAGRVQIVELRPYRDIGMAFIAEQELKGHPAITAALKYLQHVAREGAAMERDAPRRGSWLKPAAKVDALLGLMVRDHIDLRLILAWGIACELHRLQDPRRWPDAVHSGHQFAAAVVSVARYRTRRGKATGLSRPAVPKPATGLLREVARRLRDPLIPFFIASATHLHRQIELTANPVPRASLDTPFCPST